ncbi:MAG: CBS domain-containing protein [Desulfurococcales archaeon]|nr:CBS domain-containing protein [Desulfurococcales archaeon]
MLVREVISRRLVTASTGDTVKVAVDLMASNRVGSVLVLESGRLAGIFTERDLVNHLHRGGGLDDKLGDVMTRNPITVREDESLWKAVMLMVEHGIRHLPVVNAEGDLVGVLSIRDALRALVASSQVP